MAVPPTSFAEFWLYYLRAHSSPTSRLLHYLGTFLALFGLAMVAVTASFWWLIFAVVTPYALAWAGHFFIENNTPLAFSKPLWSLRADFRMFFLMLSGRLDRHLHEAQTV